MKIFVGFLLALTALAGDVSFTLAGLRMMPERWDKEANFRKLERFTRQAVAQGAQVVVTPESFLDGYVVNSSSNKPLASEEKYRTAATETAGGPLLTRVRGLARELKIYLLVGYPELRGNQVYNSVVLISPQGEPIHRYDKTHCGGKEPYNTEGTAFPVIDTPLGRWGTLICLDRQLPEPARILAIKGARMILVPSYGGTSEMNDAMMRTRAYENSVYLAFVHPKRCLIIDPKGKVLAQDAGDRDQVVCARISINEQFKPGSIRDRRPEIYGEILNRR